MNLPLDLRTEREDLVRIPTRRRATRRAPLMVLWSAAILACSPATSSSSEAPERAPALPQERELVVDAPGDPSAPGRPHGAHDPGRGPWQRVPRAEVRTRCGLDPALLDKADRALDTSYAIIRYGLLCHSYQAAEDDSPSDALSLTKLMAGLVTGSVAYATRSLPTHGRKTGPLSDFDRVDRWLDSFSYNRDAHIAHVLGMVAQNADLSLGKKKMEYDFFGDVQINSLSDVLNTALQQQPTPVATDLDAFVKHHVFDPLGMRSSSWSWGLPDKLFAFSWNTTVLDEARLGLLILHRGVWSGQRIVDADYVYRMTHPSFEDANPAWGYLTWLNASANYTLGGMPSDLSTDEANLPGPCAPVSIYATHPHGLSDAPDCNYGAGHSCEQPLDVGVWQGIGINGKVVQGHPGLDLLLVGDNLAELTFGSEAPRLLWDAVRPALVAGDPTYQGDERAFCAAYGGNRYAPDLPIP